MYSKTGCSTLSFTSFVFDGSNKYRVSDQIEANRENTEISLTTKQQKTSKEFLKILFFCDIKK